VLKPLLHAVMRCMCQSLQNTIRRADANQSQGIIACETICSSTSQVHAPGPCPTQPTRSLFRRAPRRVLQQAHGANVVLRDVVAAGARAGLPEVQRRGVEQQRDRGRHVLDREAVEHLLHEALRRAQARVPHLRTRSAPRMQSEFQFNYWLWLGASPSSKTLQQDK
jgi:hypothetical protein